MPAAYHLNHFRPGITMGAKNVVWGLMLALLCVGGSAVASPIAVASHTIPMPEGHHGVGFDDIQYASALHRVLIPAGGTGNLVLVDPVSRALTVVHQVGGPTIGRHAHRRAGTTSAIYADGWLFASDHDPAELVAINPHKLNVVERTMLDGQPDYVRYVASTREIWVTEPEQQQIQVFRVFHGKAKPFLRPFTTIRIAGGPEALEIDNQRNRAYTNADPGHTLAISLTDHVVVGNWTNTCKAARGLALDTAHDHVFVACKGGKVVTLSPAQGGKVIASAIAGAGIDIISYNAHLHHLYVPGANSRTLTVFKVSAKGTLASLATYPTAAGAHCVTNDQSNHVFVCEPRTGAILELDDDTGKMAAAH
ncbi:MAG TPA: hypothetical protein VF271_06245 [Rhodanobacteraceae bacterium]